MTTTDTRVRRLERRVARLESVGRVPPEAAEAYARLAKNAPYTPEQQARHREELLDDLPRNTRKAKP